MNALTLTSVSLSLLLGLATTGFTSRAEAAQAARYQKTTGQLSVLLAVMPAEITLGPTPASPPSGAAANGTPSARDLHHVMVSLFDLHGRRITDATVQARVAPLGFSGTKKRLESEAALGAPVYAAAFPMGGRGPFRIDIDFQLPNTDRSRRGRFYFIHPQFDTPSGHRIDRHRLR